MRTKPTNEQKQAAAARRATLAAMARKISAMPEADRLKLMSGACLATIEGHDLSPKNSCLALMQNPRATILGGFRQWTAAGRVVRKGEKSIGIFVPCQAAGKKESTEAEGAEAEGGTFFRVVSVFDVSQTEPIETPALAIV